MSELSLHFLLKSQTDSTIFTCTGHLQDITLCTNMHVINYYMNPRNKPLKGGRERIHREPRPWLKLLHVPLGWDFPILHGHSWWILIISHFDILDRSILKVCFYFYHGVKDINLRWVWVISLIKVTSLITDKRLVKTKPGPSCWKHR